MVMREFCTTVIICLTACNQFHIRNFIPNPSDSKLNNLKPRQNLFPVRTSHRANNICVIVVVPCGRTSTIGLSPNLFLREVET